MLLINDYKECINYCDRKSRGGRSELEESKRSDLTAVGKKSGINLSCVVLLQETDQPQGGVVKHGDC